MEGGGFRGFTSNINPVSASETGILGKFEDSCFGHVTWPYPDTAVDDSQLLQNSPDRAISFSGASFVSEKVCVLQALVCVLWVQKALLANQNKVISVAVGPGRSLKKLTLIYGSRLGLMEKGDFWIDRKFGVFGGWI